MAFIDRLFAAIPKLPVQRVDSWYNTLTGLGQEASDKRLSSVHSPNTILTSTTLEGIFTDDALAARIVSLVTTDALRQGYTITMGDDPNNDQIDAINKRLKEFKVIQKLREARIWSRLYGCAGIFLGVVDGVADLAEPLDQDRIRDLMFLKVIDKQDLVIHSTVSDSLSPDYGEPEVYEIISSTEDKLPAVYIHASRFIMFPGALTPPRKKYNNQGWDHSVLQKVYDTIRDYNTDWSSTHMMLTDMSQPVLKIQDFYDICTGDSVEAFKTRIQMIDLARMSGRIMPIGTEEEFTYQDRNFSGVDKILDKLLLPISIAADMPISILFGVSPSGLNATKETDVRTWYDTVHTERSEILEDPLVELIRIIAQVTPEAGDPADLGIIWPSLWQMNPNEEKTHQKTVAEIDRIYIDSGVLLADEVAEQRFGGDEYSDLPPLVDIESRLEPEIPPQFDTEPKEKENEEDETVRSKSEDLEEV